MKKINLTIALLLVAILSVFIQGNKNLPITLDGVKYKGMNLVAPIKELKNSTLLDLKNNNVNAISLIPYAFLNTDKISINYDNKKQWWGETTQGISECAKLAHSEGFKIMLKLHLWANHNFYTGNINFTNEDDWIKWEKEYENYIINFAKIAESEKMELFCFGTELKNPIEKRPQYWFKLIKKIKTIYSGKLVYAANWDEFENVPFWGELDYIGIDAYFPISKSKNPTISELKHGWKNHIQNIEKIQKKFNKKVIFTEFGYRNADYCANEPWVEKNTTHNNQAQVNSYEALFSVVKNKTWYQGGFAWKWYADDYYKTRNKVDYTPQDKPALLVLKKHYKN